MRGKLPRTDVSFRNSQKGLDRPVGLFYYVETVAKGDYLGEFEQIVLVALLQLGTNAYGMAVRREIEQRTDRRVSIGAVYATLERLEAKGYVSSFAGDPTPERGGRAKRFFAITAGGLREVKAAKKALTQLWRGIPVHEG